MKCRISIAMASYQGEKYIEEQIESIARQTVLPDELVIVDDCSTDCTVEKINRIKKKLTFDVRVVVNKNNVGYVRAFSQALEMCSGDIVFLADQDDFWLPRKLELVCCYFADKPDVQLLIHDVEYCKENLTSIGQTKIERMTGTYDLYKEYVVGMATAVRGRFLKICLPIPSEKIITHDSWLHLCANLIDRKLVLNDILALYRRHSSNATMEGNLNVDFVTGASHFKKRSIGILAFATRTKINRPDLLAALDWIKSKKQDLVISGLVSAEHLEKIRIKIETSCVNIYHRECVLELPRHRRIYPAIKLYISGAYKDFSGLKSLFKDLLFK